MPTISTLQLTKEHINTLERELMALQKKQVLDGIEILQYPPPTMSNEESAPTKTTKTQPECNNEHQPSPPVKHKNEPINDSPVHPYSNIPEVCFAPTITNKPDNQPSALKSKEPSYHMVIPIQDPKIVDDVYNHIMKVPSVTILHELLSLSLDLQQHHQEQVTLKCVVISAVLGPAWSCEPGQAKPK